MPNKLKCECGNQMEVSDPIIEIVNQLSLSAIVINHAAVTGKVCSACGKERFLAIQGFDVSAFKIVCLPVPPKPEESRIVTPNGARFH